MCDDDDNMHRLFGNIASKTRENEKKTSKKKIANIYMRAQAAKKVLKRMCDNTQTYTTLCTVRTSSNTRISTAGPTHYGNAIKFSCLEYITSVKVKI